MGAFWILQVFLSKFWTIQFAAARYQHKNYLVIIFDTNIFVYYVYIDTSLHFWFKEKHLGSNLIASFGKVMGCDLCCVETRQRRLPVGRFESKVIFVFTLTYAPIPSASGFAVGFGVPKHLLIGYFFSALGSVLFEL